MIRYDKEALLDLGNGSGGQDGMWERRGLSAGGQNEALIRPVKINDPKTVVGLSKSFACRLQTASRCRGHYFQFPTSGGTFSESLTVLITLFSLVKIFVSNLLL